MAMTEPTTEPGQWLTQAEAAARLGWQLERLKSAARRGKFQRRKGNAGQWLVLVTPELMTEPDQGIDHADDDAMAMLREELTEAWAAAARAEGRAAAMSEAMSEHRIALVRVEERLAASERREGDLTAERNRLDAELVRLRRPFWRRWIDGS